MALAGLSGLSGIQPATGQPDWYEEGWVDPYEVYAGSPAPEHSQYTWDDPPVMPWLFVQGAGGEIPDGDPVLGAGTLPVALPAGTDPALYSAPIETGSHRAPWPTTGVEDSVPFYTERSIEQRQVSADIHASDTGQAAHVYAVPLASPWARQDIIYDSAGETMLAPVPDQIRGNMGLDHVQGFEPPAQYGFENAHVRMPSAHSDVAGNYFWLTPASRPVIARPDGYRDWPVGPDSPFYGQIPGTHGLGDTQGAVIDTDPPSYTPPADPGVAAPLDASAATWSVW